MTAFDEAYAAYLVALAKLDKTDDIAEKNRLFRELTQRLSEMEEKLQHTYLLDDYEEEQDQTLCL